MIGEIHFGDCRESLRAMVSAGVRVQTCVTSPPYFGLRDYGHAGQIGLEETPEQFIAELVEVFRCAREVLADDGTLWINIGDSYGHGTSAKRQISKTSTKVSAAQHAAQGARHGGQAKQLMGIPWRLALALQADGWLLRQEIIWDKPNSMPESVTDRCVKSHEHVFLLAKSTRYQFDHKAIQEVAADGGMRNRRSVWPVRTKPYKGAHFAVFPADLVAPCILAGSKPGSVVLDPFMGSGTVAAVAIELGRQFIGCELNPDYKPLQVERITAAHQLVADREEAADLAARQIDLFAKEA